MFVFVIVPCRMIRTMLNRIHWYLFMLGHEMYLMSLLLLTILVQTILMSSLLMYVDVVHCNIIVIVVFECRCLCQSWHRMCFMIVLMPLHQQDHIYSHVQVEQSSININAVCYVLVLWGVMCCDDSCGSLTGVSCSNGDGQQLVNPFFDYTICESEITSYYSCMCWHHCWCENVGGVDNCAGRLICMGDPCAPYPQPSGSYAR